MNRNTIVLIVLLLSFASSYFVTSYDAINIIGNTIVDTWSIVDGWATSGIASIAISITPAAETNVIVPASGNLSFSEPSLNERIPQVTSLTSGCMINATLYGSSFPSAWAHREPNATEAGTKIEYFEMVYNCTLAELSRIYFNLSSTAIGTVNVSNISLFFYNTSHTSWDNLSTIVINSTNDPREFFAFVPHFSDFLIAQRIEKGGGGGREEGSPGGSPKGGGSPGGGGGGVSGGAAGGGIKKVLFIVAPSHITATLSPDQLYSSSIGIRNTDSRALSFILSVEGEIKSFAKLSEESITLKPGEEATIGLSISAQSKTTKVYTGRIRVMTEGIQKSVPLVIAIKGRDAVFDISIDVEDTAIIEPGSTFKAALNLQNIGLRGVPIGVSAEVYFTDLNKNIIARLWKETIVVSTFISLHKEYVIPKTVEAGNYLVLAKAEYDNISIEAFDIISVESLTPVSKKAFDYSGALYAFGIALAIMILLAASWQAVKFIKRKIILRKNIGTGRHKQRVRARSDYWAELQKSLRRR